MPQKVMLPASESQLGILKYSTTRYYSMHMPLHIKLCKLGIEESQMFTRQMRQILNIREKWERQGFFSGENSMLFLQFNL